MPRSHINERLHTELASTGRAAGMGIGYDKYDDEDGYRPGPVMRGVVRMPSDELTKEERAALNGPVRIVREGKA